MSAQSWRVGRVIASSALSVILLVSPLAVGVAAAQQTAIVDPNAAKGELSAHDAAMAASRKGDYIAALDFSKKAAAAGQPLDSEQVDFISGRAAKQQAALDDAAALKTRQQAAAGTAQEILDRQQKEYAARAKQQAGVTCTAKSQGPERIGTFTSAAGAASSTGAQSGFGAKITGADGDKKCPG